MKPEACRCRVAIIIPPLCTSVLARAKKSKSKNQNQAIEQQEVVLSNDNAGLLTVKSTTA
eukprot:scaffold1555_cov78-Skeletonema_dohrnii-CCMP3373.AAC.3